MNQIIDDMSSYIISESEAFPPLGDYFTVDDLGGWSRVYPELVETLWQTEIEPRLDLEAAPLLFED